MGTVSLSQETPEVCCPSCRPKSSQVAQSGESGVLFMRFGALKLTEDYELGCFPKGLCVGSHRENLASIFYASGDGGLKSAEVE